MRSGHALPSQSGHSKTISAKKRKQKRRKARRGPPTPQQLYDRGDYQQAAQRLRHRLKHNPTDPDRRLLFRTLVAFDDTELIPEALECAQTIEAKDARDLRGVGWCYLQLAEWDQALSVLNQALQLESSPWSYYLAAIAHARGKETWQLDEIARDSVQQSLRAAIALPGCPVDAFLRLEDLKDWSDEGIRERAQILNEALNQRPDSERVRCRLAERLLCRLNDPETALSTIAPLLKTDAPSSCALWLAFEAHSEQQEFAAALGCLENLQDQLADSQPFLQWMRGITLRKHGAREPAVLAFVELLADETEEFELRVLAAFGLAAAHLAAQRIDDAVEDVATILGMCLQEASRGSFSFYTLGTYQPFLGLDDKMVGYNGTPFVDQTCQQLIDTAGAHLGAERIGWLLYIQHCIRKASNDEGSGPFLARASTYLDHPVLSGALVGHYLHEANDLASAVQCHLEHAIWRYRNGDADDDRSYWAGELQEYDDRGNSRPIDIPRVSDRLGIHQIAMQQMSANREADLNQGVFEPFYQAFWRPMLVDNDMYSELVEANKLFLQIVPDSDAHLVKQRTRRRQNSSFALPAMHRELKGHNATIDPPEPIAQTMQ